MKCKSCREEIDKSFVFCPYCGARRIKDSTEVSVPEPVHRSDGTYSKQIMVKGVRFTVSGNSVEEYKAKARDYKLGRFDIPGTESVVTLGDIIDNYISSNSNVQSVSSLRTYSNHRSNRFKDYMDMPYTAIDYQKMVNDEASVCSAKTLHNAWGTVSAAMSDYGLSVPAVNLPAIPKKQKSVINKDQTAEILKAFKGDSCELAVILLIHGLRIGEACALDVDDIADGYIIVNKTLEPNEDSLYVIKNTPKTDSSNRRIRIFIDRLYELLPESGRLITVHQATVRRHVKKVCAEHNMPYLATHGFRRSFATNAHKSGLSDEEVMKAGGWNTAYTMHQSYITMTDDDADNAVNTLKNYYGFTNE